MTMTMEIQVRKFLDVLSYILCEDVPPDLLTEFTDWSKGKNVLEIDGKPAIYLGTWGKFIAFRDQLLEIPSGEEPLPLANLLEIAEVTESDVQAAADQWKQNASTLPEILEAEPE